MMKLSFRKPRTRSLRIHMVSIFLICLIISPLQAQNQPFAGYLEHPWVDSVLNSLSMEERIAQSIFLTTGPDRELSHYLLIDKLIREHGVGGLVVSTGFGVPSYFRSISRVPLAVAMERGSGEGSGDPSGCEGFWPGPPYFLDIPGPWTLGAAENDLLIQQFGDMLARQYGLMGAQLVLTPASEIPLPSLLQDRLSEHHIMHLEKYGKGMEGITVIDTDKEADTLKTKMAFLLDWEAADTSDINQTARSVLAMKYWTGLAQAEQKGGTAGEDLTENPETKALIREIYANSLTVLNNGGLIPLKGLATQKIACISIQGEKPIGSGQGFPTAFQEMAANYTRMDQFCWYPGKTGEDSLLKKLGNYDVVLAGIYPGAAPGDFFTSLSQGTQVISVCFGDPGTLSSDGLILAYRHNDFTEELAAQLIFGAIGGQGRLPLAISDSYPAGSGITTPGGLRLQYAYPENAGVSSVLMTQKIDSVIGEGLKVGAFPGCVVIAARKGKVIFHKTYGYQTYHGRSEVRKEDLYDLASVTKISGSLSGLMLLEGMGSFSHKDQLGKYVPAMRGSDKADLLLQDILAHQAGLYPWIPFWHQTVKRNGNFKRRLVSNYPAEKYSMVMADHLYLKDKFREKIYRTIRKSELGEKEYRYSGLSFFLFPGIIEELSGIAYEDFLYNNIYRRLGAWDLVYNPLRFYPLARIAPTEYDSLFRRQQIHGYVHDESAATIGGFSGNAGLFATAGDLLKLIEMYRRMGSYGGEQIIPEAVLREYTSYQFPEHLNRRGLGFDKPLLGDNDGTPQDYPCPGASPSSFGHSGFTGTFVWADPEHEISYVFLSNRVYPTRNNNLISDMNIRTEVLQAIYDSIVEDM